MTAETDKSDIPGTKVVEVFETEEGGYHKTVLEVNAAKSVDQDSVQKSDSGPAEDVSQKPEPEPESALESDPGPMPFALTPEPKQKPKKPKKPKKQKKAIPSDPKEQGKMIADSVVGGFVGSIKAMAAKRGGHLLPEDVEALSASFEKQTEKLAASLAKTMSLMSDASSKSQWDPDRVNAFDRIMVKQFSHLLGDDASAIKDPGIISRRALSGFFAAIRMMCGPERIEELEQEATIVMQRVRHDMGDDFEWEVVYDDPRTKHMIRDLIVDITPHFIELDKRMEWLLSVINANLTPPASAHAPGAEWTLSDHGLLMLIEALFAEMTKMLDDDLDRLRVTKRYGVETLELILEIIEVFENHRKKAMKA